MIRRMNVFAADAQDIIQIGLRRGAAEGFAQALQGFGLAVPAPGHVSSAPGRDLLWIQPDAFLMVLPRAAPGESLTLLAPLAHIAALVDQSDGRACFTLRGPHARDVLAKGCRLDFHPRVFGPGRVASSSIAHVNGVIQQTDAEPSFRIIVFSSFAQHFAEWLEHAVAST